MKTIHALSALSVILLGVLAGLLVGRSHVHPRGVTSRGQTRSLPASEAVIQTVTQTTPPTESTRAIPVEASPPKPEICRPSAGLASIHLASPVNSQDLDQNRDWARNFPSDALDWLETSPDGPQRVAVAEIVCPQLAQTNAVAAVKLAETCLNGGTNDAAQHLLGTVARIWAVQDIQAATNWALAKPDGERRDLLLQHITFAESKTAPLEAARLVAEQMSPGRFQNEAAVTVVYQWAQQDAVAALAWAESFPAGDLRDRAIMEVENVAATRAGNALQN